MATDKAPFAPRGNIVGQGWPCYRTGPNGERQIFNSLDEVPEGWHDGSVAKGAALRECDIAAPKPPLLPVLPAGHEFMAVPHDVAAAIRNGNFHIGISVGVDPVAPALDTTSVPMIPRKLRRATPDAGGVRPGDGPTS